MPSSHPLMSVFLHPEVAAACELLAKREDTDVSNIIRAAICWGSANPLAMTRNVPKGRTVKLQYRVPAGMRDSMKQACFYASRPVSEWVALATMLYVTKLADELRSGDPDATLQNMRNSMRGVLKQLRERGELPAA